MDLDGPVRVADKIHAGTATVTLSFDAWKGATVGRTTHSLTVLPAKAGPKLEPIASNLTASLRLADAKAMVSTLAFSSDGSRLFAAGYRSGTVQFWDIAARKEIRRIETPQGSRMSAGDALLSPDWKTFYVPFEKRTVRRIERDGKRQYRFDFAGEVRVWDVTSGKEKGPLRSAAGFSPAYAKLSADGRFLVCPELSSFETPDDSSKAPTMIWDLASGTKRSLTDDFVQPLLNPDGKTVLVVTGKIRELQVLDFATGKMLAKLSCVEKDRFFSIGTISPDGAVAAVPVGGKKGAPIEFRFLDARTLTDRSTLVGAADPAGYGWSTGKFTPDSKRFVVADGAGNVLLWNVAGKSIERTLPPLGNSTRQVDVSPDGKTAAFVWAPKADKDLGSDPDPQDRPQPRISLLPLDGNGSPRVLMAPQGGGAALAFSPDGRVLAFGGAGAVHLFNLSK